jgi:4-amino-4-deoxy-L-arabinose transferase-like glycosyltransferase
MELIKNLKFQLGLGIFLAIFSFGIIWSLIVPGNTQAPDESSHLNMIAFLKTEKRIPVFNHEDKIVTTVYDHNLPSGAYYSMAYNSPLSYLPYLPIYQNQSHDLSKANLFSLRLVSSFFLALFALFLFLSLDKIQPRKLVSSLAVTLFITLVPQVIFSAGYINIEPIALFLTALSFYLYLRLRESGSWLRLILFGIILGFVGLTKSNYLLFVVYLAFLMLYDLYAAKDRRLLVRNYLTVVASFLLINGWWWLRNYQLYGDPLILGYIKLEIIDKAPAWLITPRQQGYTVLTIFKNNDFWNYTFYGFFANLGGADIYFPVLFYWLFFLFNFTLILIAFMRKRQRHYIFILLIVSAAFLLYFANKNLDDFSPQGRHLFPLLVPLSVALFLGLSTLRGLYFKTTGILMVGFSLLASLTGLLLTCTSYYIQSKKGIPLSGLKGLATSLRWILSGDSWKMLIDKLALGTGQSAVLVIAIIALLSSLVFLSFRLSSTEDSNLLAR